MQCSLWKTFSLQQQTCSGCGLFPARFSKNVTQMAHWRYGKDSQWHNSEDRGTFLRMNRAYVGWSCRQLNLETAWQPLTSSDSLMLMLMRLYEKECIHVSLNLQHMERCIEK